MTFGMILGVRIVKPIFDRVGDKYRGLLGGLIESLGMLSGFFTTKYSNSFVLFLLCYSIPLGIGCGTGYTSPLLALRAWLPDKAGLAVGIVVMGFGLGGTLFSVIQTALVLHGGVTVDDLAKEEYKGRVSDMFLWLTLIMVCMQVAGTLLLRNKPVDPHAKHVVTHGLTVKQAFKTTTLYGLFLFAFFNGAAACYVQAACKEFGGTQKISNSFLTGVVAVARCVLQKEKFNI